MPAKRLPQTPGEMIQSEQAKRSGNKLYREQSAEFIDSQISDTALQTAQALALAAETEPVSMTDTERIVDITLRYTSACAETSTLPSIIGLSRALGVARSTIYDCIARHSPRATADWLELVKETFAEALSNSALRNETNTITSIFILKSIYGYRESNEFVIKNEQNQLFEDADREEVMRDIMSRYADLPEE